MMYVLLIVVPGIFVCVTIKRIFKAKYIQRHGIPAQGVITQVKTVRHGNSNYDHLLLEYQDNHGKRHIAKTTVFPGYYQLGGIMPLHYLQHKPSKYSVDGVREAHPGIILICVMMVLFMTGAALKLIEMAEAWPLPFQH